MTNLHIRYEDHVTRPGSTFACGMTLHSMAAFTVDDAGNEMFVKKAAMALLRKAATLSRFSMYFDTRALFVVEPSVPLASLRWWDRHRWTCRLYIRKIKNGSASLRAAPLGRYRWHAGRRVLVQRAYACRMRLQPIPAV